MPSSSISDLNSSTLPRLWVAITTSNIVSPTFSITVIVPVMGGEIQRKKFPDGNFFLSLVRLSLVTGRWKPAYAGLEHFISTNSRFLPGAQDMPRCAKVRNLVRGIVPQIASLIVRVGQMRERRDLEVGHNTRWYIPGFQIPPDKADGLLWRSGVMR